MSQSETVSTCQCFRSGSILEKNKRNASSENVEQGKNYIIALEECDIVISVLVVFIRVIKLCKKDSMMSDSTSFVFGENLLPSLDFYIRNKFLRVVVHENATVDIHLCLGCLLLLL
jgi:hypothetical protein